jgi:phospholipid/cholesterol/gamma-HCH transport system substrate-binding protein
VKGITLDDTYRAQVGLELQKDLKLPVDTTASIMTSGLLGDRYISLQLGAEQATLKAGDEIAFTESAVILERLIGKLVYSADRGKTE